MHLRSAGAGKTHVMRISPQTAFLAALKAPKKSANLLKLIRSKRKASCLPLFGWVLGVLGFPPPLGWFVGLPLWFRGLAPCCLGSSLRLVMRHITIRVYAMLAQRGARTYDCATVLLRMLITRALNGLPSWASGLT